MIGVIPKEEIFRTKNSKEITSEVKKYSDFLKFPDNENIISNKILFFGTYNLKFQPFYSDIDLMNHIIYKGSRNDAIKYTVESFRYIIKKIIQHKGWFFTDAKAGIYNDDEAVHWRAEEILNYKREGNKPDFNGHLGEKSLYNAVQEQGTHNNQNVLLKIDMVSPYFNKYIEITCVYLITYNQYGNDFALNYIPESETLPFMLKTLYSDTLKQFKKGKLFKVLKRIFSICKSINDVDTVQIIEPLLISNVSKITAIMSDFETLKLLLFLNKNVDKFIISSELQQIKEKLSTILDIPLDLILFDNIDKLYLYIRDNKYDKAIDYIEHINKYLREMTNYEIDIFLKSINIDIYTLLNTVKNNIKSYIE